MVSGITAAGSILITLALAFYSLGVWAEHVARYLKGWHVVAFWTGFFWRIWLIPYIGGMVMGMAR